MKIITTLTQSMAILIAGALLASSRASAAVTAYAADDLLLGFTKTGSTNSYVLDLGQALQYRTASGTIVLNTSATTHNGDGTIVGIGSAATIANDISTIFSDANWATDGTVQWGIIGTSGSNFVGSGATRDPASSLYASSTSLTPDTSYNRTLQAGQATPRTDITAMANSGAGSSYGGSTINAGSLVGLKEDSSFANSWLSYQPGGANSSGGSFSYFTPGVLGTVSNGATLNLFRIQPSNQGITGGQGTTSDGTDLGQLVGTFNISSNGTISFAPGPVPEPSRVLLLMGGLGALLLRRRRVVAAA